MIILLLVVCLQNVGVKALHKFLSDFALKNVCLVSIQTLFPFCCSLPTHLRLFSLFSFDPFHFNISHDYQIFQGHVPYYVYQNFNYSFSSDFLLNIFAPVQWCCYQHPFGKTYVFRLELLHLWINYQPLTAMFQDRYAVAVQDPIISSKRHFLIS